MYTPIMSHSTISGDLRHPLEAEKLKKTPVWVFRCPVHTRLQVGPWTQKWAIWATGRAHVGRLRGCHAAVSGVPPPPHCCLGPGSFWVRPNLHFPDHLMSQPSLCLSATGIVSLQYTFLYQIAYLFLIELQGFFLYSRYG